MGTGYVNKIEAIEPDQYTGKKKYRKYLKSSRRMRPREEWQPFSAPAIVSEETFELAQQRLVQNKKMAARRTKRPYLLRGLIECECCQMHMFCDTQSGNYMCALSRPAYARDCGRTPCTNKRRIPVPQLDELVWREVKAILKKPALLKKQYPELKDKIHPRAAGSLEVIDGKLADVNKQIIRTNDLFIRGILPKDEHATKYRDLESRKKQLTRQRDKVAGEHLEHQDIEQLMASFTTFAKTIKSRLDDADFETRRSIVEQLVKRVLVGKKVITIEHIAPLKKNNLCTNLQG
jgi:site-specific DNA recombinase